MMLGVLTMSILSGQLISRTGRYRVFPIVGTAAMSLGLLLLSRLDVGTSTVTSAPYMLVLGLGLGSVMQVLVLVVQNAVQYSLLGAATSGVTLFRGIGGSLGAAVFGTIFSSRLKSQLSGVLHGQPPAASRCWLTGLEDSLAAPRSPDSLAETERALARVVPSEQRRAFGERVAERAGLQLSPGSIWALVRIDEHGIARARELAEQEGVPAERIAAVVEELRSGQLLHGEDGADGGPALTSTGRDYAERVVAARRKLLTEALADPDAHRDPQFEELLRRLSRELAGERP